MKAKDILESLNIQESTPGHDYGFTKTPDGQWNIGGENGVTMWWWKDYDDGQDGIHVQCSDDSVDLGGDIWNDGYTMLFGYGQASEIEHARSIAVAIAMAIDGLDKNAVPAKLKNFLGLDQY